MAIANASSSQSRVLRSRRTTTQPSRLAIRSNSLSSTVLPTPRSPVILRLLRFSG